MDIKKIKQFCKDNDIKFGDLPAFPSQNLTTKQWEGLILAIKKGKDMKKI